MRERDRRRERGVGGVGDGEERERRSWVGVGEEGERFGKTMEEIWTMDENWKENGGDLERQPKQNKEENVE
ncbi:hypothetical protein TIFTF001_044737, partial [Ficus carica]